MKKFGRAFKNDDGEEPAGVGSAVVNDSLQSKKGCADSKLPKRISNNQLTKEIGESQQDWTFSEVAKSAH